MRFIAADILKNFHTFEIFIPDVSKKENVLISRPTNKMLASTPSSQPPPQNECYETMEQEIIDSKTKPKK